MQAQTDTRIEWGRWRLPLLAAVVLLIVLVPFLILEDLSRDSLAAADAVAHTHQVEAAVNALTVELREIELSSTVISIGGGTENSRRRVENGAASVRPLMEKLILLTRDNTLQQVRIGQLKELIDRRLDVAQRLARTPAADAQPLVRELVLLYPIRPLLDELLASEHGLLTNRIASADRQRMQARWLGWVAMVVQLLLLGLVTALLGRQMARRLHAERDSMRASARALAVLQTVREPIVLMDRQQHLLMHNAAFAELYGLPQESTVAALEDVGEGAWNDPVVRQRLGDVLARGRELWDFEHEQRTVGGVVRTLLINARLMVLPDKDDGVVLMTLSDISAQKATQQRITELNRQLQGKVEQVSDVNRELEAFSYSVSHDLRAPLRHISGFADKLARQMGDDADEKSRHYISTIDSSARRMATLIDDLLVYSRLGRSALRLQPVDMQSLVSETRALLDSNASVDTPGRRIEWHIDAMPMVIADENMMRQVWLNLLGNAVKYSTPREQTRIDVSYERLDDGRHEFTVKDNGVGFDMQYASKLFGVFQRMHKASDFPGTGIGLASVQRVLMRHGGTITAESAVDQGTTFRFTLPAMLDNPAKSLPASA